jgi:hypothetical protein
MQALSMTDLLWVLFGSANAVCIALLYLLSSDAVAGTGIFKKTGKVHHQPGGRTEERISKDLFIPGTKKRALFNNSLST